MAWPTLFCETTSECSRTERILRSHDTVLVNPEKSKPIRNPSRIPLTMISANSLSGWVYSTCSHARQSHGVETSERKAGVRRRGDGCISKRPVSGASLRCPILAVGNLRIRVSGWVVEPEWTYHTRRWKGNMLRVLILTLFVYECLYAHALHASIMYTTRVRHEGYI